MTDRQITMEGYSYRVSARFGSRVQVSVGDGMVSVIGPRVGLVPYRLWIAAQAVLLGLAAMALVASVVLWDWRYLVAAVALLAAHGAVGGFGAGCLWELMDLIAVGEGTPGDTVTFPLNAVKRVKVGRSWARRGMWLLILPYVLGINSTSEGYCVSFEAPDGVTGRQVVYALHMRTPEDAQALATGLAEGSRDG